MQKREEKEEEKKGEKKARVTYTPGRLKRTLSFAREATLPRAFFIYIGSFYVNFWR